MGLISPGGENLLDFLELQLPLEVGPMSPWGGCHASFLLTAKGWSQARSVRGTKTAIEWIFKLLLGCTLSGPTLLKQVLCGPWLGMQVHKQGEILSKPRIFLKDLGSLELSSRGKGTEKTCVWRWLCLSRSQSQG